MKRTPPGPLLFFVVIILDMLAGMEFDIFVPSFPELQRQFDLSPFWVEATLSANFLGYCISLFIVGSLSDIYGRKPIISIGLIVFILGSILCLWGGGYPAMLLGRFLQGIGIAAPAILSFLIIADAYPLSRQTSLFAILNGCMNFSVGAAPVLGSYIALYFGWRGSFMALLVVGVIALVLVFALIPRGATTQPQGQNPIKEYISLFKITPLVLMIISFMMQLVPYWIFVGMSPLLYMESLGVSLTHFGFYQGSIAIIFGLGNILLGIFVREIRPRTAIRIAIAIFLVSVATILLASFSPNQSALLITLCFLPFTVGEILPSVVLYPICVSYIPDAKGKVSSIIQAGRLIFAALSLQIAGYFYKGSFMSIGLIIIFFIVMTILSLVLVMANKDIMEKTSS